MDNIKDKYNKICNELLELYDALHKEQISVFLLNPTINELVGKINILEQKKMELEDKLNGE